MCMDEATAKELKMGKAIRLSASILTGQELWNQAQRPLGPLCLHCRNTLTAGCR